MQVRILEKVNTITKNLDFNIDGITRLEIDGDLYNEQFNEYLNETYGHMDILGSTFDASYIYKELDSQYDSQCQEWSETIYKVEDTNEYKELVSEIEEDIDQLQDLYTEVESNNRSSLNVLLKTISGIIDKYTEKLEEI